MPQLVPLPQMTLMVLMYLEVQSLQTALEAQMLPLAQMAL